MPSSCCIVTGRPCVRVQPWRPSVWLRPLCSPFPPSPEDMVTDVREGGREGDTHWLPRILALTGLTRNLLVHGRALQPTGPPGQGRVSFSEKFTRQIDVEPPQGPAPHSRNHCCEDPACTYWPTLRSWGLGLLHTSSGGAPFIPPHRPRWAAEEGAELAFPAVFGGMCVQRWVAGPGRPCGSPGKRPQASVLPAVRVLMFGPVAIKAFAFSSFFKYEHFY